MKSLAIVLSSGLVAAGLLLVSPAAANPEPEDLTIAPQNPPHSGGGGTPAGSAAPRGGGSTGGSGASSPSGGGTTGGGGGSMSSGGGGGYAGAPHYRGGESARGAARLGTVGQAVPPESRPRGDRPVTGTAVPRGQINPPPSYPGYYPPGYYPVYPGYGNPWYGYGYWGYDPFWWGFSPWYWYGGYSGYGGGYSGGYDYGQSASQATGEIKLKVKPKGAEVYVDGSFVGIVDDFDGAFQHLSMGTGEPHRIEIRRRGYETLSFDVRVDPGQSVTYRGEMQKAAQ